MSDQQVGAGWWQASDGRWYPPEQRPGPTPTQPATPQPSYQWGHSQSRHVAPPPQVVRVKRGSGCVTRVFAAVGVIVVLGAVGLVGLAVIDGSDIPNDEVADALMEGVADPVVETPAVPEPAPGSNLSLSQQNAVRSAQSYLDMTGFSRQGLIDQLSSEYGNQYPVGDAIAAVDSLDVDWNAQAVRSAQSYLDMTGFSCQGLIDQLSSEYGNKYTPEQARYGAAQAGIC